MKLDLITVIQIVFASQAMVYFYLTITHQRLLPFAALLLVFATHMTINILVSGEGPPLIPDISFSFRFAYGPLIYLFVREVIRAQPSIKLVDVWHAVPFLVAVPVATSHPIYDLLGVASIISYLFVTGRLVRSVHKHAQNVASSPETSRLDWVVKAYAALVAITAFDVSHSIGARYWSELQHPSLTFVSLLLLILLINWFSNKAIAYPLAFQGFSSGEVGLLLEEPEQTNRLSAEDEQNIQAAINQIIAERLFLKPQLKVADVSAVTGLTERFLSHAIHQHTGDRFNKFINKLRIYEAKHRLRRGVDDRVNILALSYDVGFNSKSAFNAAFKDIVGTTPSEYRSRSK